MSSHLRRASLVGVIGLMVVAVTSASAPARSTAAPRQTGEVKISGTQQVGSTLHTTNGGWANSPTSFTYQWYRCDNPAKTNCQPISGATTRNYRLVGEDAGHTSYVAVTATNRDGSATGSSDPVGPFKANAAPRNTAAPSISGSPQVGQTLTAVEGTWTNAPSSYTYQWMRCDSSGNNCGAIGGATAKTYAAGTGDVNGTLRVRVAARNTQGSDAATSGPSGVIQTGTGGSAIPVSTVTLPNQLVVGDVKFTPAVLHSRGPFTARVKVTDGKNRPVAGALVYVLGLPYAYLRSAAEVATGNDGIATLSLSPTAALPGKTSIVLFVRVRKPGEPLVGASVASRRLVQVTVRF
jgi:hypothetical protein